MSNLIASGFDTLTIEEVKNENYGNKHVAGWTEFTDESINDFCNMWIHPESIDKDAMGIDTEFDFSDLFGYGYMSEKFPGMDPLMLSIIVDDAKENQKELLDGFVEKKI